MCNEKRILGYDLFGAEVPIPPSDMSLTELRQAIVQELMFDGGALTATDIAEALDIPRTRVVSALEGIGPLLPPGYRLLRYPSARRDQGDGHEYQITQT